MIVHQSTIWPQGKGLAFPPEPVPEHINWDVWQGTCATDRPYSPAMQNMKARSLPEVDAMLKRVYRTGWEPKLT